MSLWARVLDFVKRYGAPGKFAAKVVVGAVPGGGALAELLEKVLDCAHETAEDGWEIRQSRLPEVASEQWSRLEAALDLMTNELHTLLEQVSLLKGLSEKARQLVDVTLRNDRQTREALGKLDLVLHQGGEIFRQVQRIDDTIGTLEKHLVGVLIKVPGIWHARPLFDTSCEWTFVDTTPLVVRSSPDEAYRFRVFTSATEEELAELPALRDLQNLIALDLHGCDRASDRVLAWVGELAQLQSLDLRWCPRITDAGLVHLARLQQLRKLYLLDCRGVSREGREQLGRSLPGCRIGY
jgi:hypothetical protein